ncbi:MAG: PEP-CTERM sorting domain-containing protein [Candidatus Omnitrophica bacterium]|nr:PEP-CTERM sorting domain-containing protein [Candidatus Omnitrophota bacterium]MCM8790216.1 PEP-CTERM sorting domain-containing protein [Candidatus Omnitrophota bacterium]
MTYWKLDGDASDSTGHSQVGSVNNASVVTGKIGQAYNFTGEGNSSYIEVPNNSYITQALGGQSYSSTYTVTLWFKPDVTIDSSSQTGGIGLFLYSTVNMSLNYYGDGKLNHYSNSYPYTHNDLLSTQTSWSADTWYFTALTFNKPDKKTYIYGPNGLIETDSATFNYSTHDWWVGGFKIGRQNYGFDGTVDDVAIWNRALDANEVAAIYNLGMAGKGIEDFEHITTAIPDLDLNYTTSQIKQLTDLYVAGSGEVAIDNVTWRYLSGTLPGDTGYDIGDSWTYNGRYYIKLGSGLEGEPVPEPATVVGLVGAIIAMGYRRVRNRRA